MHISKTNLNLNIVAHAYTWGRLRQKDFWEFETSLDYITRFWTVSILKQETLSQKERGAGTRLLLGLSFILFLVLFNDEVQKIL